MAVTDLRVETSLGKIVHLQMQTFHHIVHHGWRFQGNQFVVHIGTRLEKTQIGKGGTDITRQRLPLGIFLDEQGGGTGIDRWCLKQVKHGDTQAQDQGYDKPPPLGKAEIIQILDTDKIVRLGGRTVILSYWHF